MDTERMFKIKLISLHVTKKDVLTSVKKN